MNPMKSPCAHCPWRKSNQGKRHAGGWYTLKNLRRLWAGLRSGEAPGMTCHPTDPNNPLPEGFKEVSKETETKECAGALLLVIRELKLIEKISKEDNSLDRYFRERKRGLTKNGAAFWIMSRIQAAGTPLGGPPIPNLEEDPDIQYNPLAQNGSGGGTA